MKKVNLLAILFILVFTAGSLANMNKEEMAWGKADLKVENTADGIMVMVTSKDAQEVKKIQEKAAEMKKMHESMKAGSKPAMGMGMGMWKSPGMMHHIASKMDIAFRFLVIIWSLVILLLASTTVLVVKKIMSK